jgi:hypothetical protein
LSNRGVSSPPPNATHTRLHGPWLVLARVVWLALVAFVLGLFVVSLPGYVAHLYTVSNNPLHFPWQQLSHESAQALQNVGISLVVYAPFAIALSFASVLAWVVVGAVIFWRKSDDWMALLVAFSLIAWGTSTITLTFRPSNSTWQFAFEWLEFFRNAPFLLFVFLFPNGRFVPGWTRWPAIVTIAFVGVQYFFPASPFNRVNWPSPLNSLSLIGVYFIIVAAQIYRYRRVSNVIQREQTKWVVFVFAIVAIGLVVDIVVEELLKLHLPVLLAQFLYPVTWNLIPVLIPISIGIAILRSRLYDIDLIINRTLVYGTLTASLALVYVGIVISLGSLVRLFTGQVSQSPIAIVVSTLVIYVLFQPLRRRIQQIIDRRFYRRKYDAAKTLEAFSATLRNEVDLSQLREHLITVVQETMQPVHVSLWLRSPRRHTEEPRHLEKPNRMEEGF